LRESGNYTITVRNYLNKFFKNYGRGKEKKFTKMSILPKLRREIRSTLEILYLNKKYFIYSYIVKQFFKNLKTVHHTKHVSFAFYL
jgi:hypothetical protein